MYHTLSHPNEQLVSSAARPTAPVVRAPLMFSTHILRANELHFDYTEWIRMVGAPNWGKDNMET